jgi:hypothetical protein
VATKTTDALRTHQHSYDINTMTDTSRLDLLEARTAIGDLIYRYAQGVRRGDFEHCVSLFANDAIFEVRLEVPGEPDSITTRAKLIGRSALLAYLNEAAAGSGGMCPLISNVIIDVKGSLATSNSMMTATVWSSSKTVIGEYDDTFCYDGKWQFSSRIYTIFRPR